VAPHLLFPLVVTAMIVYALASPVLDFARALGAPEAVNAALRPASAILLFYTAIAVLERAFPYRREWNRSHGDVLTDALHLVFTGQGAQGLFFALAAGPPLALPPPGVPAPAAPALGPTEAPLSLQPALALVRGGPGHSLSPRLSHESAWVWRLHAAHHSAPRLYWLNATRFHVLDLFLLISFES